MPTLHFHVHGRVQGVWFRGWTRETARALGLVGWVRNEPDGSVSGAAQGRDDTPEARAALERFRIELRQGPPSALVTRVEEEWTDSPERFTDFTVRF